MNEVLRTEHVSIGYSTADSPHRHIMDQIDVTLYKGELVCITGKNGIGKSTLIRSLCGLQPVLNGKVILEDKSLSHYSLKELSKKLSIVLTDKFLSQQFTVYEMIGLGRYPYTNWLGILTEEDKKIIHNSLELCHISHLAHRHINELSDGEKQKVMIARALAQDTSIIILDEPTAHLDLYNKMEIMSLLRKLANENNKAILLSTHDIDLAMHMADKIWVMTEEALSVGVPEDLVLNGKFNQIFSGNTMQFDLTSGHFRLIHDFKNTVSLQGEEGIAKNWIQRALERKGFKIDNSQLQEMRINIQEEQGQLKIIMGLGKENKQVISIESMLFVLFNYLLKKE